MQESNSEPEKYSLDEMMDRLKRKGSSEEQGELVTREDGSQAVRIRKRKRRSSQPAKKKAKRNGRLQLIQVTSLVVVLALSGLAIGASIVYANSAGFREKLVQKLETSSGAKVELTQFRMNPSTANANMVALRWPEGNVLSEFEGSAAVGKIYPSSFFGKDFRGEEVVFTQGALSLRVPKTDFENVFQPLNPNGLAVKFERYSIPNLKVFFGESKSAERVFDQTEASFYPGVIPGQAELRLTGGFLKFKGWPALELDRSYIQVRGGELDVVSMRFFGGGDEKGYLDLSGSVRPLTHPPSHVLAATVENLKISELIGAEFSRLVFGRIDTLSRPESNFLVFRLGEAEPGVLELHVRNALNSSIQLAGFKFLNGLTLSMEDRWFELPTFDDDATLRIVRRGPLVEIRDIDLTYRGRMAVRGELAIDEGGNLKGKLKLGLSETMVASAPARRLDAMFGQVREGFRWVDLKIGGTTAVPEDDFLVLFEAARNVDVGGISDEVKSEQDSFEELIDSE